MTPSTLVMDMGSLPLMSEPELGRAAEPVVCAYNEWDPLEEVIVGILDGATIPQWHVSLQATMPERHYGMYRTMGGQSFPRDLVAAGNRELDELVHILEAEGVTVRRPDPVDYSRGFSTPEWDQPGGLYSAMPRDLALVIGEEIIEAPMAWRSRYFEVHAYRRLFKEYFLAGARWTAAPRPQLPDALFDMERGEVEDETRFNSVINEFEPTFDAADFIRCGRDIFAQRSHVTNAFGIEWLRRHLGSAYRIHELEFSDTHPMHIDATFMPLAPGKLVVNPERVPHVPEMFRGWDVLRAPTPCIPSSSPLFMSSNWLSMNVVMIDEERVLVERGEENTIRAFRDWGLKPIPCSFRNFNAFGGSFHCATLDIRRRGELQSYF